MKNKDIDHTKRWHLLLCVLKEIFVALVFEISVAKWKNKVHHMPEKIVYCLSFIDVGNILQILHIISIKNSFQNGEKHDVK